ncbi:MAG: tetratricopeptide repeat protein [Drouetiella hepatica Uher 2000/2452]|jgi:predicted O-linked N-acetylglucosamine transferase (SPINDLY family)|uniref:Tetratricopeptide repeat protein n=1 Tax=Drouetiella hepatica Uher 2000/2452 TaxID=904376 RepID=A0A951QDW8_9CYAN|nr:tetratricopeptide repeat protein [Drouetiella hepatica Uher 2000/2452]
MEIAVQADQHMAQGNYAEAAIAYEQAIALEPDYLSHYWQLGLALFLQGEGADAQLAWMSPLLESPELEVARSQSLIEFLLAQAQALNLAGQYDTAVDLGRFCVELAPDDVKVLLPLASWMQHTGLTENLTESISLAAACLERSSSYVDRVLATHLILSALMSTCGSWQDSWHYYQIHKQLLASLKMPSPPTPLPTGEGSQDQFPFSPEEKELGDEGRAVRPIAEPKLNEGDRAALPNLLGMGAFLLYFEDSPHTNRPIRNQFAAACQASFRQQAAQQGKQYHQSFVPLGTAAVKPLKIGYLSECLRQHSIGWLIRWLLQHHDRHHFEVHLYSLMPSDDWIQNGLRMSYGDRFHDLPPTTVDIADRIYADQIDILVELDSLTCLSGCGTMALKPAPIQVNWLGYDAAGIPGIDYFIADPYVLPEEAQSYYTEKIWRLPQTYIAVDGFEVHTPSLRRDQLGIPGEAIVYLSSQSGLKRNPHNIRLQMQILRAVPNSYFLIKSWRADLAQLEEFFGQFADEVGLNRDRLRFLPGVPSEFIHRANLNLADIVLDTYPYNGATTTLEALWIGLPIVTRVGEQFAARNSYTMMMNAGVTEGIAWSDDEYIEWGIRLGQDTGLRQEISHRLKRARHTSPLWNTPAFTRNLEQAYQQMWERY